jgi:hypothetical protein
MFFMYEFSVNVVVKKERKKEERTKERRNERKKEKRERKKEKERKKERNDRKPTVDAVPLCYAPTKCVCKTCQFTKCDEGHCQDSEFCKTKRT